MTIEARQVASDRAREAVGAAGERFQAADQELSRRMAENASQSILQAVHERWLGAKDIVDKHTWTGQ